MRLHPTVSLRVEYRDDSLWGSTLSDRCEATVQQALAPLRRRYREHGYPVAAQAIEELMIECIRAPTFQSIAQVNDVAAADYILKDDFLYPESVRANVLRITHPDREVCMEPERGWSPILQSTAALSSGASLGPHARIGDALLPLGFAAPYPIEDGEALFANCDITFVGHNSVVVRTKTSQVVLDPWFLPHNGAFPTGYQPIQAYELGNMDAVLITHSHPDHFDPGSLLHFAPSTKILVPHVPRESIMAVDMRARLIELGFEAVSVLNWWQEAQIGDITVTALPFYGEQPTEMAVLHPQVRNWGNTYLIRTPMFSCAFVADSGRDCLGDVREVAVQAREQFGPVDVLFSGYRGWSLYPVAYLPSSVQRYLLFVPAALWRVRQSIMTDVRGAVDLAELWHARYLVPYADGGAPWYWQRGLGPRLNGEAQEHVDFDPFPDRVVQEALTRCPTANGITAASRTLPLLLRPGDAIRFDARKQLSRIRVDGHRWPYEEEDEGERRLH